MAKGIAAIQELAESNKVEYEDKVYIPELWPALRNDGDSVVVRFLEDSTEFEGAFFHMKQRQGTKIWDRYLCLDQAAENPENCPGCVAGIPKSFKGFINVVWYDAPQVARDSEGKAIKNSKGEYEIDGYADQNVVWIQGITVFQQLAMLDVEYKGLSNRDFKIIRSGKGKDTTYNIIPTANDPEPLSQELLDGAFDLSQFTEPVEPEVLTKAFLGGQYEQPVETPTDKSPFRRKNRFEK